MSIVPDAQLAWQAAVLLCRREISRLCRAYRCTCMIVLSRESARANLFVTCVKHSVFSLSDIADPARIKKRGVKLSSNRGGVAR